MGKVLNFFIGFLYSKPETPSMKRLCGFICVVFLCDALHKNSTLTGNLHPSDVLIQTVGALAFGCLGLTAIETVSKHISDSKKNNTTQDESKPNTP